MVAKLIKGQSNEIGSFERKAYLFMVTHDDLFDLDVF